MTAPRCWLCDTAEGLRKVHDGCPPREGPEYVCESCFTLRDDGPDFDDLDPHVPKVELVNDAAREIYRYVMFGRKP